jgi:putative FmdB family regulatory protein
VPIYEYRCPKGHAFELFHGISEPAPAACTVCGSAPVERVLYPVAVHFKGSGFYSTDYGKGSRKQSKDGDTPKKDEPSSSSTSEKKAEKAAEG